MSETLIRTIWGKIIMIMCSGLLSTQNSFSRKRGKGKGRGERKLKGGRVRGGEIKIVDSAPEAEIPVLYGCR